MKKGKFIKTLAIFGACLSAPLLLTGCQSDSKIDFRVEGEYIQWTEDGKTWTNLVELDEIQGEQGVAGKQVQFQVTETHIQWRYIGETTWKNLVALEDIKGDDLTAENVKVEFDVNLPEDFEYFTTEVDTLMKQSYSKESQLYTKTITNGDWVELEDFASNEVLKEYFLGWYAGDGINETKFTSFTSIQDNITLTAKWDLEKIAEDQIGSTGFTFADRFSLFGMQDGYLLEKYEGTDTEIVVPKLLIKNNRPHFVKYMFVSQFSNDETITSITLPDTLLEIYNCHTDFEGFTSLEFNEFEGINYLGTKDNKYYALIQPKDKNVSEYTIHSSLEIIGAGAFADAKISGSFDVLPESLKSIGVTAFKNCDYLSSLSIPKNVEYIGRNIVYSCNVLTNIFVDADNQHFDDGTYRDCIIDIKHDRLIAGCVSTKIPNNVEIIEEDTFCYLTMTSFVITENVYNIRSGAFTGCSNLTTVIIESNDISNEITSSTSNGKLFENATTIYIKTGLDTTDSTYLASDYTKQATSDKTGYDMYVKNS